ncbi:MAG: TonB-dependent receptor [Acidobacteriia bacterium]|nr:TonB-dependent receptor [Terriglobia bacterium]
MLSTSIASGQSLAGLSALNGTVRDSSDAPISGAIVTVSNASLGIERNLVTNESGYFVAPSLPPAAGYDVSVKKDGFAPFSRKEIQLIVGQNISVPITLALAAQAATVTVEATAPLIEQTKTGVAQAVESKQIENLPINGRRVDQFVLLTPGAVTDGTSGLVSFRGVPGGNAFLQDGNDVTQQWGLDIAGGAVVPSSISQDAIQEFQVQTSGYSAEFGRAVGGVINTVTKSGTNQYHGTGYWYFRNRTLNAQDPHAPYNPPEWRHQAGASVGGPIVKDKLFFFGNVEIERRDFPLVDSIVNSQFYAPGGAYIGQCGAPATPAQCQAAQAYFGRFFQTVPRTIDSNLGLGKLDWRPTDKHAFTASFNLLDFTSPNGDVNSVAATDGSGIGANGNQYASTRTANFAYTYIATNSAVNEFRFGWFKDRRSQSVNPAFAPPNGLLSGLTVQGQGNLGVSVNLPNVQPTEDRFQYTDSVSWTKGAHQVKFGFDIADLRDTEDALFNGPGGYTYGDITSFALDLSGVTTGKHWQTFTESFGPLLTHASVVNYAFFAQDQWRLTPKLTFNYGLRYEYSTYTQPPTNSDYPATGVLNQPTLNFAPRAGLAYAFNRNRTVIRAGYGIFYARLPSASVIRLQQRNGVIQKTVTLNSTSPSDLAAGPVFPNRLPGLTGAAGLTNVTFPAANLATPYTEQGDVTVEHQLSNSTALTVSYLFNRGYKFISREDLNLGPPTGTATYTIDNAAGQAVSTYTTAAYLRANRIDPRYASIIYLSNRGRLWYDGLSVSLRQRASRWFTGTLAYTWSHARDLGQGAAADNIYFTDPPNTTYNGNYQAEKGSSRLDQRQRLVVSGILTPPRWNFGSKVLSTALNGWQLSLIETAATPQYVDPIMLVGAPYSSAFASSTTINGMVTPFGAPGRVPFLPRSSVALGDINRLDGRLTKVFAIRESMNLALNFEAFNVFNIITATSVNSAAYIANGNVISPIAGLGLGTASSGFPDGTNARRAQVSARFTF